MVQADLPLMTKRNALLVVALLLAACEGSVGTRESYPGELGHTTHAMHRDGTGEATSLDEPVPTSIPANAPRTAEEISGPAVQSLIAQARLSQPEAAIAQLERAQRIEPRNPFVWQMLATANLALKHMDEAESCAQKSNSLAHGNPYVEVENYKVIAETRRAAGDVQSSMQAEARVDGLNRLLGQ